MKSDSRFFEFRLFRELRRRISTIAGKNLAWRRFHRKFLNPTSVRILVCLALLGVSLFLDLNIGEFADPVIKAVAAIGTMFWIGFRGLRLANSFLSQVKFSDRSRTMLAMPAKESDIIRATLRVHRWDPLVRWIEFAVLIWIGFLMTHSQKFPPLSLVLGGATVALFASIGVALWGVLFASFCRWRLPGHRFLGAQTVRTLIFSAFIFFVFLMPNLRGLVDWASAELEFVYRHLHLIPLLSWPVRWLDPVPGQPGPAVFFAITTAVAFFPLLFAARGFRKGAAFLHGYANALIATHWRHAEIAAPPPPQKPKSQPQPTSGSESKPARTLSIEEPEPATSRAEFIEHFAHQWFTEDERRAMTVHLGTPYPAWTRQALRGNAGLLISLVLAFLIDFDRSEPVWNIPLSIGAFLVGVSSLYLILGGATPARGLRVLSLASFRAPLFSGWPIRIGDLIKADWKVSALRSLAALPVFVSAAFGLGWHFGEGAPAGVLCAVHVVTYLLVMTGTRPMFFLSSLMNTIKRPSVFQASFWILFLAGLPLILITFFLAGLGFVLLNSPDPFWQLPGVLAGAAVFLPSLAYLWIYRVLHDRARLTLETPVSKTVRQ